MYLVCISDSRNGISFNKKRQSRDRNLTARILSLCAGRLVWMTEYTYRLFQNPPDNFQICPHPALYAKSGEFCILESDIDELAWKRAERLFLFRWDKAYPYDESIMIDAAKWELKRSEEFVGFSHEKIGLEVYHAK